MTCAFLAWVTGQLAADGVRVLALVRGNASWHLRHEVRAWLKDHNRRIKAAGRGCRLLVCRLPSKSPRGRLPTAAAAQQALDPPLWSKLTCRHLTARLLIRLALAAGRKEGPR